MGNASLNTLLGVLEAAVESRDEDALGTAAAALAQLDDGRAVDALLDVFAVPLASDLYTVRGNIKKSLIEAVHPNTSRLVVERIQAGWGNAEGPALEVVARRGDPTVTPALHELVQSVAPEGATQEAFDAGTFTKCRKYLNAVIALVALDDSDGIASIGTFLRAGGFDGHLDRSETAFQHACTKSHSYVMEFLGNLVRWTTPAGCYAVAGSLVRDFVAGTTRLWSVSSILLMHIADHARNNPRRFSQSPARPIDPRWLELGLEILDQNVTMLAQGKTWGGWGANFDESLIRTVSTIVQHTPHPEKLERLQALEDRVPLCRQVADKLRASAGDASAIPGLLEQIRGGDIYKSCVGDLRSLTTDHDDELVAILGEALASPTAAWLERNGYWDNEGGVSYEIQGATRGTALLAASLRAVGSPLALDTLRNAHQQWRDSTLDHFFHRAIRLRLLELLRPDWDDSAPVTPIEPEAVLTHLIEPAKSGRAACRACRKKIAKGELRFGLQSWNETFDQEPMQGRGGSPIIVRWHHLTCAARSRPAELQRALEGFDGEVPDRESLEAAMKGGGEKAKRPSASRSGAGSFPYAEVSPSGRSKCMQCSAKIEKGALRVAVEREVDTGSFVTTRPGYLHPGCALAFTGQARADLLDALQANSSLPDTALVDGILDDTGPG